MTYLRRKAVMLSMGIGVLLVGAVTASGDAAMCPRASDWATARRGSFGAGDGELTVRGKIAYLRDFTAAGLRLRCRARALGERPEVWLRLAYLDDHTHYGLALRGHVCQDVFLFRFRPAGDRAFPVRPLPFPLQAGRWYSIEVLFDAGHVEMTVDGLRVLAQALDGDGETGSVGFGGAPCTIEIRDLQVEPLQGEPAGATEDFAPTARRINFGPADAPVPQGWITADASEYSAARGWGWVTPPAGVRRRGQVQDVLTDTLVAVAHGVGEARFRLDLPEADYLLTAHGGDPSYPARLEWWLEGEEQPWVEEELPAGAYRTFRRPLTVRDGRLVLRVASRHPVGHSGGVINWLVVEPRADVAEARWDAARREWALRGRQMAEGAEAARQARRADRCQRQEERRAYSAVRLPRPREGRTEVDLSGRWLFLPEQERRQGERAWAPDAGDRHWHTIPVPGFWEPATWWLFGGRLFGGNSGVSDNWVLAEHRRCEALTFDWQATDCGWYRQWVHVPPEYAGRRLVLCFEGVATACQVWVQGRPVVVHAGMFGPWEAEITQAVTLGQDNLIALLVTRGEYQDRPAEGIVGSVVATELTDPALNSVPHGMYGRQGGVWGPVRLVATAPVYLEDVVFAPALDGGALQVSVGGPGGEAADGLTVEWALAERTSGRRLAAGKLPVADVPGRLAGRMSGLEVEPWWPERPRLYRLAVTLLGAAGAVLDSRALSVGFRTIEARDGRVYLNGRPYWLRGANHAPNGLRPWDTALAHAFLRLMHDGNQLVTRTHGSPFTDCWLQAADEEGVAVSVEGVWPWVLGTTGEPPSPALQRIWREDWLAVMRACRNHPSVILWTLNNEMFFYRDSDPDRRLRKWKVASEMVRAMRETDGTRPVILDSSYVRDQRAVDEAVKAGLDDGDVDDRHCYYGWYSVGPMWLMGRKMESSFGGDRPAISQEFSTGYPNVDTGHPTRLYIDRNQVAQTWAGSWAYEDRDPGYFLARHAWLTKELAELGRREADRLDGLLHFATCTWVRHCYDADRLEPYPTYRALATALQPVLVSWESQRRRFCGGDRLRGKVWVVNDDVETEELRGVEVRATLVASGRELGRARVTLGDVAYYERAGRDLSLRVAEELPADRCDGTLELEAWAAGRRVSRNSYPVVVARRAWCAAEPSPVTAEEALRLMGEGRATVVTEGAEEVAKLARDSAALRRWVEQGGRLVALDAGDAGRELLPEVIARYVKASTETATPWTEEDAVFDGLQPLDIAWLYTPQGDPLAAQGFYRLRRDLGEEEALAAQVLSTTQRAHSYLSGGAGDIVARDLWGACLLRVPIGKGEMLVSTVNLAARGEDPVAGRLYANLVAQPLREEP